MAKKKNKFRRLRGYDYGSDPREPAKSTLSEEDAFSLKIIADRYLLKDSKKEPARDELWWWNFLW
jgi:hypothetical protein